MHWLYQLIIFTLQVTLEFALKVIIARKVIHYLPEPVQEEHLITLPIVQISRIVHSV
jgi:hypothetical protein